MSKPHDGDHERVKRWLLGLAERQVTAAGSRATFTSDMYFEAAESIEMLGADIAKLQALVSEAREIITIMQPSCLSGCISAEPSGNGLNAYNHPVLVRARAFLERTGK